MNLKSILASIFNQKNLDSSLKSLDKGIGEFTKGINDFGDSMKKIDLDIQDDIKKSDIRKEKRAQKDKDNLDKIWGKKE
jgi:hypothetical protein